MKCLDNFPESYHLLNMKDDEHTQEILDKDETLRIQNSCILLLYR